MHFYFHSIKHQGGNCNSSKRKYFKMNVRYCTTCILSNNKARIKHNIPCFMTDLSVPCLVAGASWAPRAQSPLVWRWSVRRCCHWGSCSNAERCRSSRGWSWSSNRHHPPGSNPHCTAELDDQKSMSRSEWPRAKKTLLSFNFNRKNYFDIICIVS